MYAGSNPSASKLALGAGKIGGKEERQEMCFGRWLNCFVHGE
jgi:hypothetical protein